MSYLSLPEAAEYLRHRTGVEISDTSVLRTGVLGHLLIVAYFDGLMRNLSNQTDEEIFGHLVVPPRHLATIENDGESKILVATSLDGKAFYSPQMVRNRTQLRVLVSELDRVAPYLVAVPTTSPLHQTDSPTFQPNPQQHDILEGGNDKSTQANSAAADGLIHKVSNRERTLSAEIESAISVVGSDTTAPVWAELTKMAERQHGALVGFVAEGIQYRGKKYQEDGEPDIFTQKMLSDRLRNRRLKRDKTR